VWYLRVNTKLACASVEDIRDNERHTGQEVTDCFCFCVPFFPITAAAAEKSAETYVTLASFMFTLKIPCIL
jgi:hypothetical protein